MRKPEDSIDGIYHPFRYLVEFKRCESLQQLHELMEYINRNQYHFITATQDNNNIYTVFFRRCVIG